MKRNIRLHLLYRAQQGGSGGVDPQKKKGGGGGRMKRGLVSLLAGGERGAPRREGDLSGTVSTLANEKASDVAKCSRGENTLLSRAGKDLLIARERKSQGPVLSRGGEGRNGSFHSCGPKKGGGLNPSGQLSASREKGKKESPVLPARSRTQGGYRWYYSKRRGEEKRKGRGHDLLLDEAFEKREKKTQHCSLSLEEGGRRKKRRTYPPTRLGGEEGQQQATVTIHGGMAFLELSQERLGLKELKGTGAVLASSRVRKQKGKNLSSAECQKKKKGQMYKPRRRGEEKEGAVTQRGKKRKETSTTMAHSKEEKEKIPPSWSPDVREKKKKEGGKKFRKVDRASLTSEGEIHASSPER